jgi:two-component system, NtrC family, nitrogen regulation sensor histidine kinase NtrY
MALPNDHTISHRLSNAVAWPRTTKSPLRKVLRPRAAIRIFGVCFLGCLTGYLVFDSPYWMGGIWTGLATAALFYETVRFVDKSERKLASFLQSLNQNDFSVTFYENAKADDYDLHKAFNDLNTTFKALRSDRESQHQLLQVVVDTAAVPMICYEDGTGEIYLANDAVKRLFNIPFMHNTKNLWRVDPALPNFMTEIRDGEKQSLKIILANKPVFLSVTSQHILFKNKNLKLVAFHDVSAELATREAETWQKLLRVLTHEISNSAIPLSTLSSYICELIGKAEKEYRELTTEEKHDILTSLQTIEQRSKSLKEFVQNFRNVNQVQEPRLQRMPLSALLGELQSLFSREMQRENIALIIDPLSTDHSILADKNLSMQVLINLVKNAVEAMSNYKDGKHVRIRAERIARYVNVDIEDTGCGISSDEIDQIFIPFYSTKKSGSGIGLSISQQIMQKQRGDISVRSVPGKGTVFTLAFST